MLFGINYFPIVVFKPNFKRSIQNIQILNGKINYLDIVINHLSHSILIEENEKQIEGIKGWGTTKTN